MRTTAATHPSSAQFRAARAMLDWSLIGLARAADVSISAVLNAEGRSPARVSWGTMGAIRVALETGGVQFLADDGDGAGVRLIPRVIPLTNVSDGSDRSR